MTKVSKIGLWLAKIPTPEVRLAFLRSDKYFCFSRWKFCSVYYKRDDLNFPIVNCPLLDSNIPTSPACRVNISQLTHYGRHYSLYSDFLQRHLILNTKILNPGFVKNFRFLSEDINTLLINILSVLMYRWQKMLLKIIFRF